MKNKLVVVVPVVPVVAGTFYGVLRRRGTARHGARREVTRRSEARRDKSRLEQPGG